MRLALAFVLALASPALAAGGGGHVEHAGIDAKTLALQILNFGVLVFLLIKFGGPLVNKALKARHEQMKADMDEAARLRAAAQARFEQREKRLANIEQEIEAMRAAIKQEAEHDRARVVAAAEEKARRIADDARFQLDQQVKEAEIRFRAEVAAAAVKIAEEILRRSVTAADEQRLLHGFVAELSATRPTSHGEPGRLPVRPPPQEEVTS